MDQHIAATTRQRHEYDIVSKASENAKLEINYFTELQHKINKKILNQFNLTDRKQYTWTKPTFV